jgi:hypothetical protein
LVVIGRYVFSLVVFFVKVVGFGRIWTLNICWLNNVWLCFSIENPKLKSKHLKFLLSFKLLTHIIRRVHECNMFFCCEVLVQHNGSKLSKIH